MKGVLHIDYYTIRLASILFSRIFSEEGTIEYTGCDNTLHRSQRLDQRPFALASRLAAVKERGGGAFFVL
jgi:hypothetical protein